MSIQIMKDNCQYGAVAVSEMISQQTGITRTPQAVRQMGHRLGIKFKRPQFPYGHEVSNKGIVYVKTPSGYVSKDRIELGAKEDEVVIVNPYGYKQLVTKAFAGRLTCYDYEYHLPFEIKITCWNMAKLKERMDEVVS